MRLIATKPPRFAFETACIRLKKTLRVCPRAAYRFLENTFFARGQCSLRVTVVLLCAIMALCSACSPRASSAVTRNSAAVNPFAAPAGFPAREGIEVRRLSDYCPPLLNTAGDTAVYVLDSGKPGANMLLAAGAHGNEIAGIYAAEQFVQFARVESGCVFVIPHLNNSGVCAGTRLVRLEHQGLPDPDQYVPPEGKTEYAGMEQRNVNRAYPGTEHAGLAQKIALAVMRLLTSENMAIAIDLHEAKPGSDLAWDIVANPKNIHAAALAVLDLEEKGIFMHLDISPPGMDGLSHKEWGGRTQSMAFLIETANPAQADSLSADKMNDRRYALDRRVAIQMETVKALVVRANETLSAPLIFGGIPEYAQ
jgi:hypothetical protein